MEEEKKLNEKPTQVTLRPHGPVVVAGDFTVLNEQGETLEKREIMAFCRCGLSKNAPFCDGAHKAVISS